MMVSKCMQAWFKYVANSLCLCLSVCLPACLSVCLPVCLSVSLYLSQLPPAPPHAPPPTHLHTHKHTRARARTHARTHTQTRAHRRIPTFQYLEITLVNAHGHQVMLPAQRFLWNQPHGTASPEHVYRSLCVVSH